MTQTEFRRFAKDLAAQYNAGRLSFEQFLLPAPGLLRDAEAQYLAPPHPSSATTTRPRPTMMSRWYRRPEAS